MWIFGYGSLLWYTDFPFERVVPGIVDGYSRRFWQLSPDHRGTPEKPGRTVTLVANQDDFCWGLAYKVNEQNIAETISYLDFREKAGYLRKEVEFKPDDGSEPFKLTVYIASVDSNPYFTGATDVDTIVETIVSSHGPSGSNLEYALRLAFCVRQLAPHIVDDHLFEIEGKLLQKCREMNMENKIVLSDFRNNLLQYNNHLQ